MYFNKQIRLGGIALITIFCLLNTFSFANVRTDEINSIRAELSCAKDKNSPYYIKAKQRLEKLIEKEKIDYSDYARLKDAQKLISEQKYKCATYELNELIEKGFEISKCNELLGDISAHCSNPPRKIAQYYKLAIQYDRDNVDALYKISKLYFKENKNIIATEYLKQTIEKTSDCALLKEIENIILYKIIPQSKYEANNLYEALGDIYVKLGEKEKSYEAFSKALAINPKDIYLKYYLSSLLFEDNQNNHALTIFNSILEENPKDFQIKVSKAKSLAKSGKSEEANKEYLEILSVYPNSKQARYGIFKIYENKLSTEEIYKKVYQKQKDYSPTTKELRNFSKFLANMEDINASQNVEAYVLNIEEEKRRQELALLEQKKQQEIALLEKKRQQEQAQLEKKKQEELKKQAQQKKIQEQKIEQAKKERTAKEQTQKRAQAQKEQTLKKEEALKKARIEKAQAQAQKAEALKKAQLEKEQAQKRARELKREQEEKARLKALEEEKVKQAKLKEQKQKEYEARTIENERQKAISKDSKKYGELKAVADKYLKLEPKSAQNYIAAANTYKQMNMPTSALKYYKEAMKLDPANSDIYYNLGLTYFELNSSVSAKANLTKAINLDPENAKAKNLLAFVNQKIVTQTLNKAYDLYEKKDYFEALEILDRGIKDYETNAQLYYYRALVYGEMKRNAAAIIDLQKAIEYDPANYMAYYKLGALYEKIKDERSALVAYERFLSIEPDEKELIDEIQKKVVTLQAKYY